MIYSATIKIYRVTNTETKEVTFYINPNSMLLDLIILNPIMKIEVNETFYSDLNLL